MTLALTNNKGGHPMIHSVCNRNTTNLPSIEQSSNKAVNTSLNTNQEKKKLSATEEWES
jgi:hypothetical protein